MLLRHIDKEYGVVYKYAENNLDISTLEKQNLECKKFEGATKEENLQGRYLDMIMEFEARI